MSMEMGAEGAQTKTENEREKCSRGKVRNETTTQIVLLHSRNDDDAS